jgi:hypothetical protein
VANLTDETFRHSSAATRAIAIGRWALPWLIGPGVALLRARPLELLPPTRCPGLLEVSASLAFRAAPDVAAATVFGVMTVVCLSAGLALFVLLARRADIGTTAAAAAALGVGLGPMLPSALAPPTAAAAVAVCAGAGLLVCGALHRRRAVRHTLLVSAPTCAIAGLLVPSWIFGLALGCGATVLVRNRGSARGWIGALVGASAVAGGAVAVLTLAPFESLSGGSTGERVAACVLPSLSVGRLPQAIAAVSSSVGPFVLALALLGAYQTLRSRRRWTRFLPVAVLAGLFGLSAAALPPDLLATPCAIALWFLAAAGLQTILETRPHTAPYRVAGALLLVAVPVLQATRSGAEERDDRMRPIGHESATLRKVTAFISNASPGAAFVEEDASFDALLRAALLPSRRPSRRVSVVPQDPERVRATLAAQPVQVFPLARTYLTLRGFSAAPHPVSVRIGHDLVKMGGMALLTGSKPCQVVTEHWLDLPDGFPAGRVALVASAEVAHGPISLVLGGTMNLQASPDGWPPRATRGFRMTSFDTRSPRSATQLRQQARDLGWPDRDPIFDLPIVLDLALHRTPRAPLALPITISGPFQLAASSRLSTPNDGGTLSLCDADPATVAPFGSIDEENRATLPRTRS